jgi:hypothetical protein
MIVKCIRNIVTEVFEDETSYTKTLFKSGAVYKAELKDIEFVIVNEYGEATNVSKNEFKRSFKYLRKN